jgi:hypothetical protein
MKRRPTSRQLVIVITVVAVIAVLLVLVGQRPQEPGEQPVAYTTPTATPTKPAATYTTPTATGSAPPSPSGASFSAKPVATAANPAEVTAEPTIQPTATPTASSTTTSGQSTLAQLLDLLPTEPEDRTGYSRDLFVHWIDANGDGCDTRHEVLIEQSLTRVTVGSGCSLSGGSWFSFYDGLTFTDPAKLDIDHMVPLAEAWDSGASAWSAARREAYANDLAVPWALIAVSASSNRSKGDSDPAEWMPPAPSAECPYLADWLAVKVRWQLAVDPIERAALNSMIGDCPGTTMMVPLAAPGPPEPPSPMPGGTPLPTPASTLSANCAPSYPDFCIPPPPPDLDCADIGRHNFTVLWDVPDPDPHHFDGDKDGIGCES